MTNPGFHYDYTHALGTILRIVPLCKMDNNETSPSLRTSGIATPQLPPTLWHRMFVICSTVFILLVAPRNHITLSMLRDLEAPSLLCLDDYFVTLFLFFENVGGASKSRQTSGTHNRVGKFSSLLCKFLRKASPANPRQPCAASAVARTLESARTIVWLCLRAAWPPKHGERRPTRQCVPVGILLPGLRKMLRHVDLCRIVRLFLDMTQCLNC